MSHLPIAAGPASSGQLEAGTQAGLTPRELLIPEAAEEDGQFLHGDIIQHVPSTPTREGRAEAASDREEGTGVAMRDGADDAAKGMNTPTCMYNFKKQASLGTRYILFCFIYDVAMHIHRQKIPANALRDCTPPDRPTKTKAS